MEGNTVLFALVAVKNWLVIQHEPFSVAYQGIHIRDLLVISKNYVGIFNRIADLFKCRGGSPIRRKPYIPELLEHFEEGVILVELVDTPST